MVFETPSDWQFLAVSECMSAIIDYRGKSPRKTTFGIPLITAKIVKGGRIADPSEYIALEDYDDWMRRGIPQPGDVVMTTEAPLGEIAQLDARKVALAQRLITLRGNESILDNTFLKFAMQSAFVQDQLRARATGTTVLGIRQSELRKIDLPIPPLSEQLAIAEILGSLDDKIELNRRMNRTLEQMAAAIFKAWFVDFEPVKAKASGAKSFPSMPQKVFDALPTEFTDSQLGPVPAAWKMGRIRNCCSKVENGGTPKRSEPRYWDPPEVPWLTSGEVRQSIITDTENRISTEGLESSSSKLWPAGVTVVALYGATAGQVCFLAKEVCANQACCGLTPLAGFRYYNFLHMSRSIGELERQVRGSAQQNLSQQIVADTLAVLPSKAVMSAFDEQMDSLFSRWTNNLRESQTLAEIRDALLPKLLSGEIRVGEAGRIAEEVA